MNRKLNRELHKAAAMTFEELAFMFVKPEYEEDKVYQDDLCLESRFEEGELYQDEQCSEPEYEADELAQDDRYESAAIVEFQGAKSGKLILSACARLVKSIAENMLGEEDITKQQQRDAFGEIANVICGNVLPRVVGVKKVFNLSAPEIVKFSEIPDNFHKDAIAAAEIYLDQGKAGLLLFFNENNT